MNQYKKNSIIELTIDDLGSKGEGIGHIDGYAFFIKNALPGEIIRAKVLKVNKSYGFAKCMEILESNNCGRIDAKCPVFYKCGGCDLQHMDYKMQLAYKENKVINCLKKIGGFESSDFDFENSFLPIAGMEDNPWNYRNKASFVVGFNKNNGKCSAGFYVPGTHSLVPLDSCLIQQPVINHTLKQVICWVNENGITPYDENKENEEKNRGIIRHVYIRYGLATGDIMVCVILRENLLSKSEKEDLISGLKQIEGMKSILLNINDRKTNVIMGKKNILLWGTSYIEDEIGGIRYRISPNSFYQVNPIQTGKLYDIAVDFMELKGNENVLDLFCGIGTISLYVAKKLSGGGTVYGVEIVEDAVNDAKLNAELNDIHNAGFTCMPAEKIKKEEILEISKMDIVVVDPPRKGCEAKLLKTIVEIAPQKIIYVSCDPATMSRDLRILADNGYELKKVKPCEMFPWSHHVEVVSLLQKMSNTRERL